MRLTFLFQIALLAFVFTGCSTNKTGESKNDILWYEQPAQKWEDALPLGNGRLGVMVFGNPEHERIQLNDDSMWPGDLGWEAPDGNADDLKRIRQLLFEGKNAEADAMFVEKFSRKSIVRSHQTLGDLYIDFNHKNVTDYRRELSLNDAVSTVSYKVDGKAVNGKVLVSHPHRAIVIEYVSEAAEGLNAKVRMSRPMDDNHSTAKTFTNADNCLIMQGEVTQRTGKFESKPTPILHGVKFESCLKIKNEGGEVIKGADYLELKNVKKATFYLVSNSSFYNANYAKQNEVDMAAVEELEMKDIEPEHKRDFKSLYSRVELNLGKDNNDTIPTDQRLNAMRKGKTDLGMEELLFHYGRYLLISSSRVGTNPANLQGLWNQHIEAPWNADYHLNINLQMNYWLADVTNLGELNYPLFDYVDKLVESGKVTASKNFGCSGSFIPHATDLWVPTFLRAPTAYWGCSVGAGGWMMQHYWQHYKFTGDVNFLRERAYPAIEEVAKFYSDWLIEDPRDGRLISAPSTSPENRFIHPKTGKPVATCLGTAMDQQIIAEVFNNYIKACEVLNVKSDFLDKVKQQRVQLRSGLVTGSDGRMLEWDREYEELEPGHRHMSHLYAFHPGVAVSKTRNPEVFEAVRKTLDYRLDHGGAGTGWSRAWLINCSARLLDGEMAHEHIQLLFTKSMYSNLFDAHPPFQIDGNFGYTAGVAEMLVQSHEENMIRILPALPSTWKSGSVKGLRARSGITIDIAWDNNQLKNVVVTSDVDQDVVLVYGNKSIPAKLKKGIPFKHQESK
ncbi:glycoside hydrolase family 95 protein [Puteibacter caeruleilacunae]|nr:glycoside hydrolase family 95 protein [Puteibacter caeruleilacunae]